MITKKMTFTPLGVHLGFGPREYCGGLVNLVTIINSYSSVTSGFRQCSQCGDEGPLCQVEEEWRANKNNRERVITKLGRLLLYFGILRLRLRYFYLRMSSSIVL